MIQMRAGTLADVSIIAKMFDKVLENDQELGSQTIAQSPTRREQGIIRALLGAWDTGQGCVIVGEYNGEIAGFVFASMDYRFDFMRDQKSVYVFAAWLNQDLPAFARAIILKDGWRMMVQWGKGMGATCVWANIWHGNQKSRKLMTKLGMRGGYIRFEGALI